MPRYLTNETDDESMIMIKQKNPTSQTGVG